MAEVDEAALIGHWIHSYEEDGDGKMIFRREGFAFPRARGRASFELQAGHIWMDRPISSSDGNLRQEGRWTLSEGTDLNLSSSGKDAARVMRIITAEPDRLVLQEKG